MSDLPAQREPTELECSVIAVLLPGSGALDRYAPLVAKRLLRLKATTTDELDRIPRYTVPAGADPLATLLAARAEDDR